MTTTDEQREAQREHAKRILDGITERQRQAEEARTEKEARSKRQAAGIAAFGLLVVNTGPGQPWESFQCDEIETVAELLRAFGLTGAAEKVLDEHSDGDDDPGDEHHDRFLVKAGMLVDLEVPDSGSAG